MRIQSILKAPVSICLTALMAQGALAADLSSKAMDYFKKAKYVEAATTFAQSYVTTHSATDCYYTALSYHYGNNSELARKYYQETIQKFPNSREAGLSQQALVAAIRPITTTKVNTQSSTSNSSTPQPTTAPTSDPVDDLLAKAEAADMANQPSTADSYYSDAIRNAEKLGQTNPKLVQTLELAANYYAKHQRTDKALAAYDRERNLLKIRYGEDSVQCGNNLLAIARMFKSVDNVDDAKTHYYDAINTYNNALLHQENKSSGYAAQPRALLASTLDELANFLYNLTYSAKGYGNVDTRSSYSTDMEVSRLRTRAENVRAGN